MKPESLWLSGLAGRGLRALMLITLALALLGSGPVEAEEMHTRFFRDITLGSGVHFQRWNGEGDQTISEFSIPITFIVPVSKKLSLDLVTGSGFATLDRGSSTSLNGLTDTKVRASYIVGDEMALITAGLSTPTGKTELDASEQMVSLYLSQNALGFRTPNFGQGLDINVGVATARKLGEMVLGVGVGYLMKGEFTPWDGGTEYAPGNELSLTAGLDRKVMDGEGKLTLDVVYTLYGEDKTNNIKTYQSGNKILVQALGRFKAGGLDWRVHLIERSKAENTSYWGINESASSNGNQLEAGLTVLKSQSRSLGLRGLVDLKLYGENEFKRGKATMFGIGPGVNYKLSPRRSLDLNLKYCRGSLDDASLSGIDLSGRIWIRL